ncbi:MAG: CoA activase [Oscillibacter sp.]|nr:CoA activase [Oscillibacter sp.]
MSKYYIGIDIGSTCAKTVILGKDERVLLRLLQPTGWSSVDTAEAIRRQLAEEGFPIEEGTVAATGYGRVSVPYADKRVTEITCHGKGACWVYGAADLTVIDIGGQDTKIIQVQKGAVADFLMNDKCSAGTGRFLEIMANTLAVRPEELCRLAARGGGASISSMCTVFAESEVISLIGRGEKRENIAFAVVDSIVKKVASQAGRLCQGSAALCLTGGLCEYPYLRQSLSQALGHPVQTAADGRYAGALGAALSARAMESPS